MACLWIQLGLFDRGTQANMIQSSLDDVQMGTDSLIQPDSGVLL